VFVILWITIPENSTGNPHTECGEIGQEISGNIRLFGLFHIFHSTTTITTNIYTIFSL
jgi:hypothetical protein